MNMNSSGEGTSKDAAIPAGNFNSQIFVKVIRKKSEVALTEVVRK